VETNIVQGIVEGKALLKLFREVWETVQSQSATEQKMHRRHTYTNHLDDSSSVASLADAISSQKDGGNVGGAGSVGNVGSSSRYMASKLIAALTTTTPTNTSGTMIGNGTGTSGISGSSTGSPTSAMTAPTAFSVSGTAVATTSQTNKPLDLVAEGCALEWQTIETVRK
jgi:hypothetical protein